MKLWILIAITLGFTIASAKADPLPPYATATAKLNNLTTLVKQQCRLPELQNYSQGLLKNYLRQSIEPETRMLNTGFVMGFSPVNSDLKALAYCVVVFMGYPNDPYWEPNAEFYQWSTQSGTLPDFMFAGFENDNVLIKPLPDGGVN